MTSAGPYTTPHNGLPSGRATVVRLIVGGSVLIYFLQLTVIAPEDLLSTLGFSVQGLGGQWWSVVTFPLVNSRFWPMATSLAVIGTAGAFLERRWGSAEFGRYIATCLLGAWVATVALGPARLTLSGSGAAALGVLVAFAALSGGNGLFRVGALVLSGTWLTTLGSLLVLGSGILSSEPGAASMYLIHATGLLSGWAYLRVAESVNIRRLRENMAPVPDDADDMPPRVVPRRPARERQAGADDIVSKSHAAVAREAAARDAAARDAAARAADAPLLRDPALLNGMLDKISAHGIESLTAEERKLLDDLSRRLRDC